MAAKPKKDEKDDKDDAGKAEVQEAVDAEQEQGFVGVGVDPTPDENYTLPGQAAGKPTPETDEAAAEKARTATRGS